MFRHGVRMGIVLALLLVWGGAGRVSARAAEAQDDGETAQALSNNQAATTEEIPEPNTVSYLWYLKGEKRYKELLEAVAVFMKDLTDIETDRMGTCMFMNAEAHRGLGDFREAERDYLKVISEYEKAVFTTKDRIEIKISPLCKIGLKLVAMKDKTDFSGSSASYTALAWRFLRSRRYDDANSVAEVCINTFHRKAHDQQLRHIREHGTEVPALPANLSKCKEVLKNYWALYDVATCYYIRGQASELKAYDLAKKKGSPDAVCKLHQEAVTSYCAVIEQYPSAQCFDRKGPWWWTVWDGARKQILAVKDRIPAGCKLAIPCSGSLEHRVDSPAFGPGKPSGDSPMQTTAPVR